jgi:hypothetical protein
MTRATSFSSQNSYANGGGGSKHPSSSSFEQGSYNQRSPSFSNAPPSEYMQKPSGQNRLSSSIHSLANMTTASGLEASAAQISLIEHDLSESIRSSVAEVLQKHEAINWFSQQQTPLGPIEKLPFTHNFLVNSSPHKVKNMLQQSMALPESALTGKENSPIGDQKKGAQPSALKGKNGSVKNKKNKGLKSNL